MEKILAVFGNRSHSMQFASNLKRIGVRCSVINTPRELSVSCGISVLFDKMSLSRARTIVDYYKFSSFNKFYYVVMIGGVKKYKPI